MSAIVGEGTTEGVWSRWLADRPWPSLDLAAVAGRRVVVLAAHPDDEVLGVGGLLTALAARHHKIVIVWASDGEASHPRSTAVTRTALGRRRREESRQAIARLALEPVSVHHLGLPDSALAEHRAELDAALGRIICPGDLVIAPWCADGHPDHDAVGAAAAVPGTILWQYPIWMWHWATPGDEAVPWIDLHIVPVPDPTLKAEAIAEFASQVEPLGDAPEDAAILPPHVVARFTRRHEWVLT